MSVNDSHRPVAALTLEVITDLTRFAALADQWRQMPQVRLSPLADHVWMQAAWDHVHVGDTLHVLSLRSAGKLMAVAPLVSTRRIGTRRFELLGVAALNEPACLLFDGAAAANALADALTSSRAPLVLQRVAADDAAVAVFVERAAARGRVFLRRSSSAPYVDIASDWDSYLATLSSRRRYDYRRNRKRLRAEGDVRATHHVATPDTVSALFARFVAVEAAGWKSDNGSSLRTKPALREFFEAVAVRWSAERWLRVSVLEVNGQDVAGVLWLVHGNRAWVLKIGYDERWSKASPGIQLVWDVLQIAFEQRLSSFEFLGGDEPWLSIWTVAKRHYRTVIFYPRTVQGWWALVVDSVAAILRKLDNALRPW